MPTAIPEKILLVWIGRVGDFAVSTPFIKALRSVFPGKQIDILVREYVRELAGLVPGIDRVIALPDMKNIPGALKFFREYIPAKYRLCVDLNSSYSRTSGLLTRLSGAEERVSFDKYRANWFYNTTISSPAEDEHMLKRYGRLAEYFKAPYDYKMLISPKPGHEAEARKILSALNLNPSARRIALHPGNFKKYDHRWPEEKFIELAKRILSLNKSSPATPLPPRGGSSEEGSNPVELLFIAGPGEEAEVRNMMKALPPSVKFVPPMKIGTLAAFLKLTDLFVVSATGTMHLAAAVQATTLSLHSDYTWNVWRPLDCPGAAIPSGEWNSLRGISVETVWRELLKLLQKNKSSPKEIK